MLEERDFFISYNNRDEAWAEWIAQVLDEAGYSLYIQKWDCLPGHNFIEFMQTAAAHTAKTIAVLSQTYLDSNFTKPEWYAAIVQDPNSSNRKLIPVRVSFCDLDGLLPAIVYVDLVDLSEPEAKQKILEITQERLRPVIRQAYPASSSPQCSASETASRPAQCSGLSLSQKFPRSSNEASCVFAEASISETLSEQTFKSLQLLNYMNQVLAFNSYSAADPLAIAFTVSGGPGKGQRWLINRLIHSCLAELGKFNKIVWSPRQDDVYIEEFWQQFGDLLMEDRQASPSKIIDHLVQSCQQDNIVVVIHDADRFPEIVPSQVMEKFWQPLVQRLHALNSQPPYSLYLFLVDNFNMLERWGLELSVDPVAEGYERPISLPVLENFQERELQRWVSRHRGLSGLLPDPNSLVEVSRQLWQRGLDGHPEQTLQAICKRIAPEQYLWHDFLTSLDL